MVQTRFEPCSLRTQISCVRATPACPTTVLLQKLGVLSSDRLYYVAITRPWFCCTNTLFRKSIHVACINDRIYSVACINDRIYNVAGINDKIYNVAGINDRVYNVASINDRIYNVASINDRIYNVAGINLYPTDLRF